MISIPRVRNGLLCRAKPLEQARKNFPYDEIYILRIPQMVEYLDGRLRELALSYYHLLGEYNIYEGDTKKGKWYFSGVSALDRTGSWTAGLAFLLHQHGILDEAMKYYLKTIKKGVATSDIYTNLGSIYEQSGKREEALKYYNSAISIAPDSLQPHYNLAVIYWKQSDWGGVIREFNKVLEINPSNESAKRFLASALLKQRKNK
jgi:tetratricopeptide (TPR) repeat protein